MGRQIAFKVDPDPASDRDAISRFIQARHDAAIGQTDRCSRPLLSCIHVPIAQNGKLVDRSGLLYDLDDE
jgi:hypothetical protein